MTIRTEMVLQVSPEWRDMPPFKNKTFKKGDIVTVKTSSKENGCAEYFGKISEIKRLSMMLDMSRRFENITREISYIDIVDVDYCDGAEQKG